MSSLGVVICGPEKDGRRPVLGHVYPKGEEFAAFAIDGRDIGEFPTFEQASAAVREAARKGWPK